MKEEFIKYLKRIGIKEALGKRIETVHEFYQGICRDEITGIFVTDYIKEDGSREHANLWFFSETYCVEAKQFITKDDFDHLLIKHRVLYWQLKKQDYDFKKATEKSRLYLRFALSATNVQGDLKAAKENCDYLKDIFLKYIVPNLQE